MILYRISQKTYIHELSGIGAALYGGRWNPKGMPMVYTSGSISLATLEYLVHNFHLLKTAQICLAKIEIEAENLLTLDPNTLPKKWNEHPESMVDTQYIGRGFLKGQHYAMKVPSAIVPGEFNFLLNPNHTAHSKTKLIEVMDPFRFDARLLALND